MLLLQLLIVGSGLTLMVLPGIYFFYVYRFALFELCEDPGIGPVEAMRRARIHAYGYKRQLFAMDLRFLPWILLSRLPANLPGPGLPPPGLCPDLRPELDPEPARHPPLSPGPDGGL